MAKWTGKTRGNLLGYQIVHWIIGIIGLRPTYFILKIISTYFIWFAPKAKKHIFEFYKYQLGYSTSESNNLVKKNFYLLAQSIADKMALSIGKGDDITFSEDGFHHLKSLANQKKGAFLISAHLSNWDVASRELADLDIVVNVVMQDNEHENIKQFLGKQNNKAKFKVIPQRNDMSHLIKIYQAIKKGEFVCLHADRFVGSAPTIEHDFFGKKALFPAGPFQMISKLRAPYTFVFTTKTNALHYKFSATKPKIGNSTTEKIATEFIDTLKEKVKKYPAQWFNYHDFYSQGEDSIV